jgi:chemotaxis methyl-accepting protein methylase
VIRGILRHLCPSGLLFVGHSEHLGAIAPNLKTVAPTIHALPNSTGIVPQTQTAGVTASHS